MFRRWWRQRQARRTVWDRQVQHELIAHLPGLATLPAAAQQKLAQLSGEFLADKNFYGAMGLEVDAEQMITIATLACWPVLELGYESLTGWGDVIVCPRSFSRRAADADPDNPNLVHEYTVELAGETSMLGPVVVGWAELVLDLESVDDGQCVVIHEIAHKLDGRSGAINGVPDLPRSMSVEEWSVELQQAYEHLGQSLSPGAIELPFDPYGAESPPEFFAVCTEYYCLRPDLLRECFPGVYRQFRAYFGPISS